MKKWIMRELTMVLSIIVLMIAGATIGIFVTINKIEMEYAEEIINLQEELYEANIELTEAETYIEGLEEYYEMEIDYLEELHALEVYYLEKLYQDTPENSIPNNLTGDEAEAYQLIINQFGSLARLVAFMGTWELAMYFSNDYIPLLDFYEDWVAENGG